MRKDLKFEVSEGLTLSLEDLWAKVSIRTSPKGIATVVLEGEEKFINQVKVEHPNPSELTLKGEQGGNTVIMGGGSSIVLGGRGNVVIGGNIRGSVISSGNLVIINGRVVSGGKDVTVTLGDEMLKIKITVPEGTDLSSHSVEELDSNGLRGKLSLSLSGQQQAVVGFAKKVRVSCSGQSEIQVTEASGDLNVSTSGQSSVAITGSFEDVETHSSGQSHIGINGNCRNFEGDSSGQSSISVLGSVSGRVRKHSSGQSNIRV